MHKFHVDPDKCISCGACVRDCLFAVLEMRDRNPFFAKPDSCIGCLHCYAVCPMGAISMDGHNTENALPMKPIPTTENMEAFIRQRRSIRSYKKENIGKDTIQNLLEMAWNAPSGENDHLLQISVIDEIAEMDAFRKEVYDLLWDFSKSGKFTNKIILDYLGPSRDAWLDEDKLFRGAPHLLMVSYAKNGATGMQDADIYLSYLEILAWTQGLGTLWSGFLYYIFKSIPELEKRLGMPDGYELGYVMVMGKPAVQYQRGFERGNANIHIVRNAQ